MNYFLFFYVKKIKLISERERETYKKREQTAIHPLVHSSNACNGQYPGTQSSSTTAAVPQSLQ